MSFRKNPRIKRIVAAMKGEEAASQNVTRNLCMRELNSLPEFANDGDPKMQPLLAKFAAVVENPKLPIESTSLLELNKDLAGDSNEDSAHYEMMPVSEELSDESTTLLKSYQDLPGNSNADPENVSLLASEELISINFTPLQEATKTCLPSSSKPRRDSTSSDTSSSSSTSSSTDSSSSSSSKSGKDFSPDDTDRDPDYLDPTVTTQRRVSTSSNSSLRNCGTNQQEPIENINQDPVQEPIENLNEAVVQEVSSTQPPNVSPIRTRKRKRNISKIRKAKILRNRGQQYTSVSKLKKLIPERKIGASCGAKCRLKCSEKITEYDREVIFKEYWELGDLMRQRDFIAKSISVITPRYQYKVHNSNRGPKHSFYFEVNNTKIRVCKLFFKNTLAINNRPIATVIQKSKECGFLEGEKRGKHGKYNEIDPIVKEGVKRHIDSIPRIESHYLRQQTTREYIDGGKNLTDLYRDYQSECINNGVEAAKIHVYRKVFNEEYNISSFKPKKDQCELCLSYKNDVTHNTELKRKYEEHQLEKELSRKEKEKDKLLVNNNHIVACYDLQAVLPLPKGDVSTLYYKCKLNVYDFTISELANDYCECFVWSEVDALRGANEIATCVLKYLTKRSFEINNDELQVTFYSDNCCGQQKNQFMFAMYIYAVSTLKIKSITHKFLISGHTQNENDAVHSLIEKFIKKRLLSGPLYVPDGYINIIKNARKKGNPYNCHPMCHSDFYDIKNLTDELGGRFSKNTLGDTIRLSDIKVINFEKNVDDIRIYYKTSFAETEFKEIAYYNSRSSRTRSFRNIKDLQLKPLYQSRLKLSDRKNNDLKSLIQTNIIPQYYAISFYNNILD